MTTPHESVELLGRQISAALRNRVFQSRLSRTLPLAALRRAVEDEFADRHIFVNVVGVEQSSNAPAGVFEVVWQPPGGGKPQRQWFHIEALPSREPPT